MNFKLGIVSGFTAFFIAGGFGFMTEMAHGNGTDTDTDLPHADGRHFESLDTYLAHLQELGTIGIAWFEAMPDGRYQLITRRPPGQEPEIFTREDLLQRFGFEN
jgi:hypothetical protein